MVSGAGPVSSEPNPRLQTLDHVGLAVADLDDAIAFHVEVLGLDLRHREINLEQDVEEAMLAPALPGGPEIQLLAPRSPTSVIARFLARSGPGLHHLAYRVEDVSVAAAVLRRRGLHLLYDAARSGTRGSRINFVHPGDGGGVLIELVEPRPATRRSERG